MIHPKLNPPVIEGLGGKHGGLEIRCRAEYETFLAIDALIRGYLRNEPFFAHHYRNFFIIKCPPGNLLTTWNQWGSSYLLQDSNARIQF